MGEKYSYADSFPAFETGQQDHFCSHLCDSSLPIVTPALRSLDRLGPYRDDDFVRLLAWWYICIGVAFIALAARALVLGAPSWGVWLRLVVAVGFVLLGIVELRRIRARRG